MDSGAKRDYSKHTQPLQVSLRLAGLLCQKAWCDSRDSSAYWLIKN